MSAPVPAVADLPARWEAEACHEEQGVAASLAGLGPTAPIPAGVTASAARACVRRECANVLRAALAAAPPAEPGPPPDDGTARRVLADLHATLCVGDTRLRVLCERHGVDREAVSALTEGMRRDAR